MIIIIVISLHLIQRDVNQIALRLDIVPNTVHYVLFEVHQISFVHFISMLSVLKNQKPELIYIHCNCHQLYGNYYHRVLRVSDRTDTKIIIRYTEQPSDIFGHKLKSEVVGTRVT